jgi:hypothetical protein
MPTTIRRVFDPSIEMPDTVSPVGPTEDPAAVLAAVVAEDVAWTRQIAPVVEHEATYYPSGAEVRYVLTDDAGTTVQTDRYTIETAPVVAPGTDAYVALDATGVRPLTADEAEAAGLDTRNL